MTKTAIIRPLSVLLLAVLALSCDSAVVDEDTASPQIRIFFVGGEDIGDQTSVGKLQTTWDVRLTVSSRGGADYSPDVIRVNDAVTNEAVFQVELPVDSVYAFTVTYSRSGSTIAIGSVVELVTRNTSEVTIPVMFRDGSVPTVGFLPSNVRIRRGGQPVQLELMYFGPAEPVSGIACRYQLNGSAASSVTFDGPDVNLSADGKLEAAWRFVEPIEGVRRIGTVSIPVVSTGTVCLSVNPGDARTVSPDGSVRSVVTQEACVEVVQ